MISEDYRSMAFHNVNKFIHIKLLLSEKTDMLDTMESEQQKLKMVINQKVKERQEV